MSRRRKYQQPIPLDRTRPVPGAWDLLGEVYDALRDYAALPTTVSELIRNKQAVALVENKPLLVERAQTLAADCKVMADELVKLKDSHLNRRGDPRNETEHMQCLDIHSQYMDWAGRFESVVYPTYNAITQQFGDVAGVTAPQVRPTELNIFKQESASDHEQSK